MYMKNLSHIIMRLWNIEMTQKETNVWKELQIKLSPLGFRLFRNQRYKGKSDKGAWLDCGVGGDGGSDLIGGRIITITTDMVGSKILQFVAIEAKIKGGYATKDQKQFIEAVTNNGGFACVARCVEDVLKIMQKDA